MNTYLVTDLIGSQRTESVIQASSYFEALEIYIQKTQNEGCFYHVRIELLVPKNEYWEFKASLN